MAGFECIFQTFSRPWKISGSCLENTFKAGLCQKHYGKKLYSRHFPGLECIWKIHQILEFSRPFSNLENFDQPPVKKAHSTLQASESLQIPTETSQTVTEGSDNISGGGEVAPAEEDVPEFMFDFVVGSDDEEEIGDDTRMDEEIASEGELELFIRTLQDAQNAAQAEERLKEGSM
ncbi:hypothetical protein M422DRAFT_241512 [Sphaerobolus stellatus SS14]|nr:hypothetical protein M422DRAFT_241512 [Sphaerobolus stellatus SS14]